MKKRKNIIVNYDSWILLIYLFLVFVGIFMQLNINSVRTNLSFFINQLHWLILSLFFMWFSFKVVTINFIRKAIFPLLLITLGLLIAVLIKSLIVENADVNGSVRSIKVLGINIQPSLLSRVVLVLFTTNALDRKKDKCEDSNPINFFKNFNFLLIIIAIFFGFILSEKHFTPLIISGLTIMWLFVLAKIRFKTIFLMIVIVSLLGFFVIKFGPQYRSVRMKIFHKYSLIHKAMDKAGDYKGDSEYQIRESLIALASGHVLGRGPNRGMAKHYFLPEAKTDYIFSIIGEDFGLWGSFLIFAAYCFLFWRTFQNSVKEKDHFLKFAGIGLGMNIFFNAMVNMGVAMSALPSTGVTLPFISYGGTSLLVNSITIGLLLNISAERRRVA